MSFHTSEEKQLSCFQKWILFQNSLMISWPQNQVKCRWKNKIISELFTIRNVEFGIVTFLTAQSLIHILLVSIQYQIRNKIQIKYVAITDFLFTIWTTRFQVLSPPLHTIICRGQNELSWTTVWLHHYSDMFFNCYLTKMR